MNRVLNVILTHQRAECIEAMTGWWCRCVEPDSVVLAFGGTREEFARIGHGQKVFIDDLRLRTVDHPRERQSYGGIFRAVADWMRGREFDHVHFSEYDHVPLIANLNRRQVELLTAERADVLGYHVRQVDGTNCAHALYHASDAGAGAFWKSITRRADAGVVLSMIATGSFWTREAFEAVARQEEPFPVYVEIFVPTLAHHLGFRVRDFGAQTRFVRHAGDWLADMDAARAEGAWTLHPVKGLWERAAARPTSD